MKIQNIRYGFATNSSSTHSIVFIDGKGPPIVDKDFLDYDGPCFGWGHFTAVSADAKRSYLSLCIKQAIGAEPQWVDRMMDRLELGRAPAGWAEGYVDHQSEITLPREYGRPGELHEDYVRDLGRRILRDDVAILGGNDNDGGPHPLQYRVRAPAGGPVPNEYNHSEFVALEDGAWWVVFDRKSGWKMRFSFRDDVLPCVKASTPELVDVKITDFCTYGCAYCYQGSTPDGAHAEDLYKLVDLCSKMKVLEVALGGGEPTNHPRFVEIVEMFRAAGIVPSFTTRNLDGAWSKGMFFSRVWKSIGGMAYSVDHPSQVDRLHQWAERMGVGGDKVSIQVVVGSMSRDVFREILSRASTLYMRVTLLGWKATGRGVSFEAHDSSGWLRDVGESGIRAFGVDTALASRFPECLEKVDPTGRFHYREEGKFSCYIDAVAKKIGPSSYCDPLLMYPLSPTKFGTGYLHEEALERFSRW